jgi:hypothetical protein
MRTDIYGLSITSTHQFLARIHKSVSKTMFANIENTVLCICSKQIPKQPVNWFEKDDYNL